MNDNFLFQLRDLARIEPKYRVRKLLKDAADKIESALKRAADFPSAENMRELNGAWAIGARIYKEVTAPPEPNDNGGRMTVPVDERRAA